MFPKLNLFYMSIYGGFGYDFAGACSAYLGLASGIPQTGNPPFGIAEFLAMYPKFFGSSTAVTGVVTEGSQIVTASTVGILPGQLVSQPSIPAGTVVLSVGTGSFTLSANATANDTTLSIYEQPPIPLAIIQAFLNLAYASLMQSRWREIWTIAMGWYIAHFLTLYMQSEGNPGTTPGQIAASGLEQGIAVSQSAGDVSFTQQNLTTLESWAAFTKTTYGTQLATMAQVVGAGATYYR